MTTSHFIWRDQLMSGRASTARQRRPPAHAPKQAVDERGTPLIIHDKADGRSFSGISLHNFGGNFATFSSLGGNRTGSVHSWRVVIFINRGTPSSTMAGGRDLPDTAEVAQSAHAHVDIWQRYTVMLFPCPFYAPGTRAHWLHYPWWHQWGSQPRFGLRWPTVMRHSTTGSRCTGSSTGTASRHGNTRRSSRSGPMRTWWRMLRQHGYSTGWEITQPCRSFLNRCISHSYFAQ